MKRTGTAKRLTHHAKELIQDRIEADLFRDPEEPALVLIFLQGS